jgi:hypothetical protein
MLALQNRCIRDIANPASGAHSASPEIADSNNSCVADDRTDKRPRPFLFDVFAEGDEGLVDDGQPLAKRWAPSFLRLLAGTY